MVLLWNVCRRKQVQGGLVPVDIKKWIPASQSSNGFSRVSFRHTQARENTCLDAVGAIVVGDVEV